MLVHEQDPFDSRPREDVAAAAGTPGAAEVDLDDSARGDRGPERQKRHRGRYLRLLRFFLGLFVHVVVRDIAGPRLGLRFLRGDPHARWVGLARRYRLMAVRMGGVLIKLGQYLSTRVDVLPLDVTSELAGLQDEVPAEPFDVIRRQIEDELGRPLDEIFSTFLERPLGAASFAQVHEAQLPGGRPVVVKVLRPGIEAIVETDLAALERFLGWVSLLPAVRRRVDLDWLTDEFAATTRRELDLLAEGHHAERFARNFADRGDVHVPEIEWRTSSRRVLTEENVAYIKVTDLDALRANGIDPREVAKKLYGVYMEQIFEHHFVHADPHPGNVFVRPLVRDPSFAAEMVGRVAEVSSALHLDEAAAAVGLEDAVPSASGPPFQILFIDFGMVAEIPPRLRQALRTYLVGIAQRDPARVIQALRDAGSLLPGADLAELEEAVETVFDRFWGIDMSQLSGVAMGEATALWKQFGDLVRETPIQVQVDLMFAVRAIELLTGITSTLDPEFNPWAQTVPYARRLALDRATDWRMHSLEAARQLTAAARLPARLDHAAGLLQRGRLTVRSAPSPELRRRIDRLDRSVDRVGQSVFHGALLVAGALLGADETLGVAMMAGGLGLFLVSRVRRR
ncbi:MAG: AarF/UbiB family protein [Acidobacteriota bacterium]